MASLDLGVIGNCQIAALVDESATIVWSCLPQFDADPMFCRLLRREDEAQLPGFFEVDLLDAERSDQSYLTNTAVLRTDRHDRRGGVVRITDLAPRYEYVGRMFTPMMLLRRIDPVAGRPRVRIRLRPARNYGAAA